MAMIRPSITEHGFITTVKDYDEPSVVEELAANSYDADATTVIVLLDINADVLYIMDDGDGFDSESIAEIVSIGGGDKESKEYSRGKRPYLGSYGVGLKSTLNIAKKFEITTASIKDDKLYTAAVDWTILKEALKDKFEGYPNNEASKPYQESKGSIIKLFLKNPTNETILDIFGKTLGNLPTENGGFKCYYGLYSFLKKEVEEFKTNFTGLKNIAENAFENNKLKLSTNPFEAELGEADVFDDITDKIDKSIKAKIYFAGTFPDGKVKPIKESLRGIYVRVFDRLLKHNFSDPKFVYGISHYNSLFSQGMRVEINVDWLRGHINLARDGVKFATKKSEDDFKGIVTRIIGSFIRPRLVKIKKVKDKEIDKAQAQRIELAKKRTSKNSGEIISSITNGFIFRPVEDAEVAILLAQKEVMNKIDKNYRLVDYNASAPFDCIIYNESRMDFIFTELEPNLMDFLQHKLKDKIHLIIVWTTNKWRLGSKKKGTGGTFELINNPNNKHGNYKLLHFANEKSKKPKTFYDVIVLEEILK